MSVTTAGVAPAVFSGSGRRRNRDAVRRAAMCVVLFAFLLLSAVASQLLLSAYERPMGSYPDEASHFLSSLLIRDYLASGAKEWPVAYAKEYYAHYPGFAVGYWPPLFYVIGAAWMTVFGDSRTSMLMLMAVICAALQYLVYRFCRARFDRWTALACAAGIAFMPAVAHSASLIMTDIQLTLFCFAACISFGWLLRDPSPRRAIVFGLLAAAAVLTKSSALWLVLVPPLTMALAGRIGFLRRREVWLAAGTVLVLYVPWLLISHSFLTRGLLQQPSTGWLVQMRQYVLMLLLASGPLMLAAGAAGTLLVWFRSSDPVWHAIAIQPVCVGLLLASAPVSLEVRYGLMAMPAVLALACYSMQSLAVRIGRPHLLPFLAIPLVASTLLLTDFEDPPRISPDFGQAMDFIASAAQRGDAVLVSSDRPSIEVLAVAEFALRDPSRPTRKVVRANKLLAAADWNQTRYELVAKNPADVLQLLDRASVNLVFASVRAVRASRIRHHGLLLQSLASAPDQWRLVFDRTDSDYVVYQRTAAKDSRFEGAGAHIPD